MSKHRSPERKLHVQTPERKKLPEQKRDDKQAIDLPRPPKGTNANNQYR
ncbi:MAG TPA: hypothetical protein VFW90_04440 [Candidatus Saccharimonadales bacterium]|nr:hypothetical protein [Candidatus Saccharimonadales bacterium]